MLRRFTCVQFFSEQAHSSAAVRSWSVVIGTVYQPGKTPTAHQAVKADIDDIVVVVFTLKTVLTSIQYLLFLTLQGKETNFRGHKLYNPK